MIQNVCITFDTRNPGKLRKTFCVVSTELLRIRDGAVVKWLAPQQCDLGFDSDPVPPAICWLSLLLVVISLRGFFNQYRGPDVAFSQNICNLVGFSKLKGTSCSSCIKKKLVIGLRA